jgi:FtsH-binding integral membrane protein
LAASAVAGGLSLWATITVLATPYNQCDNMAGTCIHMRQQAAIGMVRVCCLAATIGCLLLAVSRRGKVVRPAQAGVFAFAAVFAVVVLATDPVAHLDNRWTGWLAGNP